MIGRTTSHKIAGLLLAVAATAVTIAGCGSELRPEPTATADLPATVTAAVALALGTPVVQSADAPPETRSVPTTPVDPEPQPGGTPDIEATINAAVANYAIGEDPDSLEFWAIATPDDARRRLEQEPGIIDAEDELGRTPLSIAVSRNPNAEVTAILLDHRGSFPRNILHTAVYNSNPDIARLLLNAGADIMADDQLVGWTPLHTAAWDCCNTSVIALLLQHGADLGAVDFLGRTACHMAREPRLAGTADCDWHGAKNIALLCQ